MTVEGFKGPKLITPLTFVHCTGVYIENSGEGGAALLIFHSRNLHCRKAALGLMWLRRTIATLTTCLSPSARDPHRQQEWRRVH